MKNHFFLGRNNNSRYQISMHYHSNGAEQEVDEVYCQIHLNPDVTLWDRIKNAWGYILDIRPCEDEDPNTFVFRPDDAYKLLNVASALMRQKVRETGERRNRSGQQVAAQMKGDCIDQTTPEWKEFNELTNDYLTANIVMKFCRAPYAAARKILKAQHRNEKYRHSHFHKTTKNHEQKI